MPLENESIQDLNDLAQEITHNPVARFFPSFYYAVANKRFKAGDSLHTSYQRLFSYPLIDFILWFQPKNKQNITARASWNNMRMAYLRGDMETEEAFNYLHSNQRQSKNNISFLCEKTSSFWAKLFFPSSLLDALTHRSTQKGGDFNVYKQVYEITESKTLYNRFLCYFFPSLTCLSLTPIGQVYKKIQTTISQDAQKLLEIQYCCLANEIILSLESKQTTIHNLIQILIHLDPEDFCKTAFFLDLQGIYHEKYKKQYMHDLMIPNTPLRKGQHVPRVDDKLSDKDEASTENNDETLDKNEASTKNNDETLRISNFNN